MRMKDVPDKTTGPLFDKMAPLQYHVYHTYNAVNHHFKTQSDLTLSPQLEVTSPFKGSLGHLIIPKRSQSQNCQENMGKYSNKSGSRGNAWKIQVYDLYHFY